MVFDGRVRDGIGSGHHFMATYKLCCFRARPDGRSLKTLHGILPAILPAYVGCSGWNKFFYPRRDKDKRSNISTSLLNTLLCLHLWPINLVVFQESQRKPYLGMSLALRCFQRLSLPYIATQRCRCHDNCHTRSTSFQVLSYYEMNPSSFLRPRWIRTELSHDVLNPASVPL